jgi:hypothetical protein
MRLDRTMFCPAFLRESVANYPIQLLCYRSRTACRFRPRAREHTGIARADQIDHALWYVKNPKRFKGRYGYQSWREDRFEDMLVFRDIDAPATEKLAPLHFSPTCIGCSKTWACTASRQTAT